MKRRVLTVTMLVSVVLALASSANAQGSAAKPSTPRALFDVACHAPSTCMAVGPDDTEGQADAYSVAVAVDGGKRWAIRFQTPRMEPEPFISCGSATSCTMAGNLAPSDRPVTYWTSDGGASWHLTQVPTGTDILTGISCASRERLPRSRALPARLPPSRPSELRSPSTTEAHGSSTTFPRACK